MNTCGARTRQRGEPCRLRTLGAGGRCKFHGGKSTGPRTHEGRQRISHVQTERWKKFRAENPLFFAGEISARQERRIRRAFHQRQNLTDAAECKKVYHPKSSGLATHATQPDNTGPLEGAVAAEELHKRNRIEAMVSRMPIHRLRRLERRELHELEQAHGQELIERYGREIRRPTVSVGHKAKKDRR